MSNCYRYLPVSGQQGWGSYQLVSEPADPWSHGCPQSSSYFLQQQPWPYPTPSPQSPVSDTCGMYYTSPYSYHASMPVDPFSPYSTTMQSFPSTQMHQPQQQYYCAPCLFDKITVQHQLQQGWRQQQGDHDPQLPYVSSLHRVSSLHSQEHAPHQQNALQIVPLHSQATGPEQPLQKQQQEETELKMFDEMPVRKLGSTSWCRRCKIECESMEGLVIHSLASEHQHKTMSLVLSIKCNIQTTTSYASTRDNMAAVDLHQMQHGVKDLKPEQHQPLVADSRFNKPVNQLDKAVSSKLEATNSGTGIMRSNVEQISYTYGSVNPSSGYVQPDLKRFPRSANLDEGPKFDENAFDRKSFVPEDHESLFSIEALQQFEREQYDDVDEESADLSYYNTPSQAKISWPIA